MRELKERDFIIEYSNFVAHGGTFQIEESKVKVIIHKSMVVDLFFSALKTETKKRSIIHKVTFNQFSFESKNGKL